MPILNSTEELVSKIWMENDLDNHPYMSGSKVCFIFGFESSFSIPMVQHPSYPVPILLQDSTDSCGTQRNFAISNLKNLTICKSNGKWSCFWSTGTCCEKSRNPCSTVSICSWFKLLLCVQYQETFRVWPPDDRETLARAKIPTVQRPNGCEAWYSLVIKHGKLENGPFINDFPI